jgi:two-component system sensor histidine kinase AlgZ
VRENLPTVFRSLERVPQFWVLQLVGWGAYASIVAIGVAPHLRNRGIVIVAFEAVFVISTFVASFPLHLVCRRLWRINTPWPGAMFRAVLTSGLLALPCAIAARLAELAALRQPVTWISIQAAFEGVLYATFIFISWSGLYFSIKHYQAFQTERERVLEAEALARQARLQALRYQLNPHFLFNTLNSISTLISEGDSIGANGMLAQLAGLLRSTLEENALQEIPLRREIVVAQEYLAIEKARLGERLNVVLTISPETLDLLVPALLLQPLIENAIRHGIAPRPEGGTVRIETYLVGERFRLNVSDDGVGDRSTDGQEEWVRGGIGLANTIERLRVLYEADHRLVVKWPAEGGCRIEVEFPRALSNSHDGQE